MTDAHVHIELLIIIHLHYRWLLHNVPLIRLIRKENLSLLFEAKRAHTLAMWLQLTRIKPPEPFFISDKPMEILKLDKELSRLKGHVYDIRDVLFDGIHHNYKTKLYTILREKALDRELYSQVHETYTLPTSAPFILFYNENEKPSSEKDENGNGTIFKDAPNISDESDKSYDEYAYG